MPPSTHAIAVLPFANLTGDPDQDYFCEGMADELINALLRLENLRVAARVALSRFRSGSAEAVRRIGERLRVDKLLQGSVRKAGARLRVTVQLINVADGFHVWSERYDREMADVFAVQDEIALRVVEALRLRLAAPGAAELAPLPASRQGGDLEAYHLCLRGRYHWNRRIAGGLAEGLRCFEQAIARAPDYAPAHAGVANSYVMMGFTPFATISPHQAMPRARAAALEALELDPGLADAHTCLGFVKTLFDWDWMGAEADFRRSLALDPGRATTHAWYSVFLMSQGQVDAAQAEAHRAWELEPLSPIGNAYRVVIPSLARRQVEQARVIAELRHQVDVDPAFAVVRSTLGLAYAMAGQYREAIAELEPFLAVADAGPFPRMYMAYALAGVGDRAAARRVLDEMHAAARQHYVPPYCLAIVYSGLGESEEAFSWLDRSVAERDGLLTMLAWDPGLDALRGDPRLGALVRRVGLPSLAAGAVGGGLP